MDNTPLKIYLCGPIHGKTDAECSGWRAEAARALLPHTVCDPMVRDFRDREAGNEATIVEGDKADILTCDVLLARCPEPSFGTAMEILFAWERRIPAVAVSKSGSPWLHYHATVVVPTVDEAAQQIMAWASLAIWTPAALRKAARQNFPTCALGDPGVVSPSRP